MYVAFSRILAWCLTPALSRFESGSRMARLKARYVPGDLCRPTHLRSTRTVPVARSHILFRLQEYSNRMTLKFGRKSRPDLRVHNEGNMCCPIRLAASKIPRILPQRELDIPFRLRIPRLAFILRG